MDCIPKNVRKGKFCILFCHHKKKIKALPRFYLSEELSLSLLSLPREGPCPTVQSLTRTVEGLGGLRTCAGRGGHRGEPDGRGPCLPGAWPGGKAAPRVSTRVDSVTTASVKDEKDMCRRDERSPPQLRRLGLESRKGGAARGSKEEARRPWRQV